MCCTSPLSFSLAFGRCSLVSLFTNPSFINFTTLLWLLCRLCISLYSILSMIRNQARWRGVMEGDKMVHFISWNTLNFTELELNVDALEFGSSLDGISMVSGMLLSFICAASTSLSTLDKPKEMVRTLDSGQLVTLSTEHALSWLISWWCTNSITSLAGERHYACWWS